MQTKFDHFPLFIVARCLEKAKSVANLAEAIDINATTIYTWLNMEHGPSRASTSVMENYLKEPVPVEATLPQRAPASAREDMVPLRVFVVRHAISQNRQRIIFCETGDGDRVFMPPVVTDQAFKKCGDGEVLPLETAMTVMAYKDRSGRSDYIAYSVEK